MQTSQPPVTSHLPAHTEDRRSDKRCTIGRHALKYFEERCSNVSLWPIRHDCHPTIMLKPIGSLTPSVVLICVDRTVLTLSGVTSLAMFVTNLLILMTFVDRCCVTCLHDITRRTNKNGSSASIPWCNPVPSVFHDGMKEGTRAANLLAVVELFDDFPHHLDRSLVCVLSQREESHPRRFIGLELVEEIRPSLNRELERGPLRPTVN